MNKTAIAAFLGTFMLVFFGVGSAVLMDAQIGFLGIALAFGLSIVAAAYGLGAISGAQLNPPVSLGFLLSGRMTASDFVTYAISQILGATAAALVIMLIAQGTPDYTVAANGLGQNGWGAGNNGGYSMTAAFLFEFVASFVFVTVILGATQTNAPVGFAGLAIGLTLAAVHLVGINVTGTSVNPARSIGPALFVGGQALSQLWLFIIAPLAGGALAGVLHGTGITRSAHTQTRGDDMRGGVRSAAPRPSLGPGRLTISRRRARRYGASLSLPLESPDARPHLRHAGRCHRA